MMMSIMHPTWCRKLATSCCDILLTGLLSNASSPGRPVNIFPMNMTGPKLIGDFVSWAPMLFQKRFPKIVRNSDVLGFFVKLSMDLLWLLLPGGETSPTLLPSLYICARV